MSSVLDPTRYQTLGEAAVDGLRWVRLIARSTALSAALLSILGLAVGSIAFVAIPMAIVGVVSLPLWVVSRDEPVGPWLLLSLSILVGIGVRSLAIQLELPDADTINSTFLLGQSQSYFVGPGLVVLAAVVMLTGGYLAGRSIDVRSQLLDRAVRPSRFAWNRVSLVVAGATVAAAVFLLRAGGIYRLSSKRRGEAAAFLVALALAWALALMRVAYHSFRLGPVHRRDRWLSAAALAVALAVPFYASNRSALAWVVLSAVVVWYAGRRRINRWAVVGLVALLIIALQVTIILRSPAGPQLSLDSLTTVEVIEPLIINRNLADISKTAHIVNAVPEVLDYEYGATLVTAVVGLVPRVLWPSKPTSIGVIVTDAVFEGQGGGVPPGFFGEMYWNFGLGGTLVAAALFGFALALVSRLVWRNLSHPLGAILYSTTVLPLAFSAMGGKVGSMMSSALLMAGTVGAVAWALHWLGGIRGSPAGAAHAGPS
jgi:hypothetical protein